ncbi:MAG: hypothetical protein FJ295_10265 [Planctomycetes bacterium]|nr:hypothetical protein [Planctomycetota bacterium]
MIRPDPLQQRWETASRWRQYEAELRVNLLRICAVGAFYGIHLLHRAASDGRFDWLRFLQLDEGPALAAPLHLAVTAIAAGWLAMAWLVHALLRDQVFPRWMPLVSMSLDVVFLTATLVLANGARSPLVLGYFLILAMTGLRMNLLLVRMATGIAIGGYLMVLGCTRWPMGLLKELNLPSVPRYQQLMVVAGIALTGIVVGQWVRHVRKVVDDLCDPSAGEAI